MGIESLTAKASPSPFTELRKLLMASGKPFNRIPLQRSLILRRTILPIVFLGWIISTGCPKPPQFCCLDKYPIPYTDQTRPAATYCGDHSQAVNFYLAALSPKSAKAAWLNKFEQFYPQIEDCADPQCIAESIKVNFDPAGFDSAYQAEHGYAETALGDQTKVSLSAAEKAELIRCGFADAIGRASKNLKGE